MIFYRNNLLEDNMEVPSLNYNGSEEPQNALHQYILFDLKKRFPGTIPVANQQFEFGLNIDFAIDLESEIVLVEVKKHRASVEDVMRLIFFKSLLRKEIHTLLLYAPVFSYRVRELALRVDVELVPIPKELTRQLLTEKKPPRKVKLTSPSAWNVVLHFIRHQKSSINHAAETTGTSYSWANAVVHQLLSQGILERKGRGTFILLDVNKLLNGISWERSLKELEKSEWTVESNSINDVLHDIVEVDPNAVLTGYLAIQEYFDIARRVDFVQVYSKHLVDLELQLGTSENGIRISVLEPDRRIRYNKAGRLNVRNLRVADPDQLILDIAGLGYAASDILKQMLGDISNG